jgi:ParB/RepB/Spo0J family partition protein
MSQAEVNRLAEEIKEAGFLVPLNLIPTEDGKYFLLGGEHRWRAAKLAGLTHVPSLLHTDEKWNDRDLVDLETFKLNAIKGKVSMKRFTDFYQRMSVKFGADKLQSIMAVNDDAEWKKLTKNIQDTLKAQGASQGVLEQVKEAEKTAKSPDDLSKMLEKIFKKQRQQIESNTIIFQFDKNEYVMIKANVDVYVKVKKLVELANSRNVDVNVLLDPMLENFFTTEVGEGEKKQDPPPPC